MRWKGRQGSEHIEDRRGGQAGGLSGKAKLGGGVALVVAIVGALLGLDVGPLLGLTGGQPTGGPAQAAAPRSPEEQAQFDFVSVILKDTEITWTKLFEAQGQRYQMPKLVVFSDGVDSACGFQSKAVGPFYCPGDRKA
ncbi:MAG: neutral zinc metallopeptidase, partial [Myxococcales bacterium]|nr:neutral zinc metallopeptidase [Myxococcales bacterium]